MPQTFFINLNQYFVQNCINIFIGDFNCKPNPKKDNSNSILARTDHSRKHLTKFINSFNLIDVWRNFHPQTTQFTWRRYDSINDILYQSRIDFILMQSSFIHHCVS